MSQHFQNKLVGKSIVVVGGTSGVGYAVAEGGIDLGANVVVLSRSQDKVNDAVQRLKATFPDRAVSIRGLVCDITSESAEADITKVFRLITDDGSTPVDHVVSTAGGHPNTTALRDATAEDLVAFSKYHFVGDAMLAKVATKYLRPANASSITMTGGAGTVRPPPGWSLWASVGGAKDAMARGLAVGLAPIRVNLVSLGAIRTELLEGAVANWGEAVLEGAKGNSLLGIVGDPRDVAETYLGIMKNYFQTGTITLVEGGATIK
ncbi:hypothetical protein ACHAPT_013364 [Fusarium lateritium]